jgi:hypothetical protein
MPTEILGACFFLADHAVVEDADRRPLAARFDGQFRVGTAPNMRVGNLTIMPVAAHATNFVLERPDDYVALLQVDNRELARWRFRAVEAHGPGTQAGAGSGPVRT